MRILLTNDDGIDSRGLHQLAWAMAEHGDVTVVAPDREYSGAGAAVGAMWEHKPLVTQRDLPGVDASWAVNGPPALCVIYANLGLFGDPFDLVVSGINPGANVGHSIYHSGTIGACLTARNAGITGVAVSQAFPGSIAGQTMSEIVDQHLFETAAAVASEFVGGLIAKELPADPLVVNINVPNVEIDALKGWKMTTVGTRPTGSLSGARLVPTADPLAFGVDLDWVPRAELNEPGADHFEVENGFVSVTLLGKITELVRDDVEHAAERLSGLISRA